MHSFTRSLGSLAAALTCVFAPLLTADVLTPAKAVADTPASPVELTTDLLDHWVAVMRQVGNARLNPSSDATEPSQPARLREMCRKAGFATAEQCGCTVLYAAVLMNGFDKDAKAFIDPARVLERRIGATFKRTDMSPVESAASLQRDRSMLFALRKALPNGVPPEHLALMGDYFRSRMTADVNQWRELAAGMKSPETHAIGDQCSRLPGLVPPTK